MGKRHPFAWRRGVSRPEKQTPETHEFCIGIDGVEYGPWITESGRSIGGISPGDLVESFPHAIEWLLRNELAVPTSKINIASFDAAYTILSGWEIAGVIMGLRPIKEHIESLLTQSKSRMFRNDSGEYEISVNQATYPNLLTDGGLNVAGAAPPVMQSWPNGGEATQIIRETTLQRDGDSCVKLIRTTALGTAWIGQTFVTEASTDYILTFWAMGDGTNAGRYNVYDVSNSAFLVTERSTGVSGTTWTKVHVEFSTVGGGISTFVSFVSNISVDNAFCFADDISIKRKPVTIYDDYKFEKDSNIFDLDVDRTPLNDVLNNVRINYKKNHGNGEFMAESWIKCLREYSGSFLNEDVDNSEVIIDVDDGTDFNATTRKNMIIDDEVSIVTGVAANSLTVTRGNYSSVARAHDDNTPIDILLVDSSDSDAEREDLAVQSAWKYRTNKEVIIDADMIIDSTTAINLRNHLFDYYRKPRWIIEFSTGLNASDIKMSSIIEFDDTVMDDWLKLGGESWENVKFEVINIRRIDTMTYRIKAIEI